MSTNAPEFRLRDAAVTIYAPSTLYSIAEGAATPVIALVAVDRGAPVPVAAVIAAMIGIGAIVSNIPASMLAARVGERRAMLIATAVSVTGLLLCSVDLGLPALGAGALSLGLAGSVFVLARQLYLTNAAPAAMRARALSTLGGCNRLGTFVGPLLGGLLIAHWRLEAAFVVAIAAALSAGAIVLFVPDPTDHTEVNRLSSDAGVASVLRDNARVFLTLGLGVLGMAAVRQGRQVALPLWGHHLGLEPATTSIIFGVSAGIDALLFYPAGSLMDRFGRRPVALACPLLLGLGFTLLPLTSSAAGMVAVAVVIGLGNGLGAGIGMTLGADHAPPEGRAVFLGIWREFADIGAGAGPLLLSALTALAGLGAGVIGMGCMGFLSAAAFARWVRNRPDG